MKKILNNKYSILIPILILNIISIIYLSKTNYILKHSIYIIISYLVIFITSKINYKTILKYSNLLYIISIILLIIVLIIGKEINGAKAWLHIFGISIQPSEIAKLSLVLYISNLAIKNKGFIPIFIITLIPSILTFLEPDTGAIIFYLIILTSVLKYIKSNKKIITLLLILLSLFITINFSLYFINKDILINTYGTKLFYRIDRLISFKNQNNIQNTNSLISIGSHNLIYIPENHNDFIFASIISKYPIFFPIILISYGGSYLVTLYILIGISININNSKVV